MKAAELSAINRSLLPELRGFAAKGQMLIMRPLGHTLRGVFLDRSTNPRGFYVQVFIQPLFVPADHIGFNVGWRLGGGSRLWNADEPGLRSELCTAVTEQALPFLKSIQAPIDTARAAASLRKTKDPYVQQAIAYSFARGGDVEQAILGLSQLVGMLNMKENYLWQQEIARRAEALAAELLDNPSAALGRLEATEAETAKKLGLDGFL
jgi:hypothetical protein